MFTHFDAVAKPKAKEKPKIREHAIEKPPSIQTPQTLCVKIFPPFAEFIDFGGASKHTITNCSSCRIVFKIKCSDNAVFKVSPVHAFLDQAASTELQILRKEGPPKQDKLIIVLKEAKKSDKDAKLSFESDLTTVKHVIPLLTRIVEEF
ncbi:unnamed protein product [Caenorhabditis angaria]|uniref:Major sperm protein n=1 Tax=Caenorhabditis angaria TaxID=860376 RepID=A0A9P1IXJ1_9PELO|nr:unnamed protein product [Caenorhabditis angaria]